MSNRRLYCLHLRAAREHSLETSCTPIQSNQPNTCLKACKATRCKAPCGTVAGSSKLINSSVFIQRCQSGKVRAIILEWPNFEENPAVFEEFVQQLNDASGYRFQEVTLREGVAS